MGEMMARMDVDQDRIKEAMITSKEYLKVAGGIGIWFRRTSMYAAGGLAIIMLGAVYYHVVHTPIMEGLVAFIVLLICGYIVKRRGTGIIG